MSDPRSGSTRNDHALAAPRDTPYRRAERGFLMHGRPGGETPRLAFGCMAVAILALLVIGAFAVIFLWDVNTK